MCLRASSFMDQTKRSQEACRGGRRGGHRAGFTPLALSRPSKACVNLDLWKEAAMSPSRLLV